jgi:hypothetical protein
MKVFFDKTPLLFIALCLMIIPAASLLREIKKKPTSYCSRTIDGDIGGTGV